MSHPTFGRLVPLLLACAALAPRLARAQPAAPAAATPAARVYTGPDGIAVAIVPAKDKSGKIASADGDTAVLIQVSGSRSEFDGKAIPHDVVDNGNGSFNYTTKLRGRTFVTIPLRGGRYELYVPGHRDGVRIAYDEKKSQAAKAEDIYKAFDKQRADGSLARLQTFDRKGEIAEQEKALRATVAAVDKSCGTKLGLDVKWPSITDDDIMAISISGYCGEPLATMAQMCDGSAEAKQAIGARLQSYACTFGKEPGFDLTGSALTWTATRDASNLADHTRAFLDKKLTAATTTTTSVSPARAANGNVEAPPWGRAESLGERSALEKTTVCTDGRSHYVVVAPHDRQSHQLYYGDGKKFFHVPLPDGALSGDNFFEPRYFAAGHNADFRGLDMRLHGSVDLDARAGRCQVTCGERTSKLEVLGAEAKKALLLRASYEPSPHRRKPHHLARDKAGVYYYVDRGSTPENEKDFRLYVGLKGQMKLQKMTNIVADTQGEIFETKSGSLRYIVPNPGTPQNPPLWVKGRKETPLFVVPLESTDAQSGERVSNYGLVYNDLGVYVGAPLGNPCDDL